MSLFEDLKSGKVKPEFGNLEHIKAIEGEKERLRKIEEKCKGCAGTGKIDCPDCEGEGEIDCPDCEGEGA